MCIKLAIMLIIFLLNTDNVICPKSMCASCQLVRRAHLRFIDISVVSIFPNAATYTYVVVVI